MPKALAPLAGLTAQDERDISTTTVVRTELRGTSFVEVQPHAIILS